MHHDAQDAITALRRIFWGGLLCIFDLAFTTRTGSGGFRFDLLNDLLGMILITVGVFRLGRIAIDAGYRNMLAFCATIAVLGCIDALQEHVLGQRPNLVSALLLLLGAAGMAATVVFCVAMRRLSRAWSLERAAASWSTTILLFSLIYLIPLGGFYLIALVAMAAGTTFHLDLGPAALLLLPVFAVPVVHLFVSTSRMKRGIESWR